MTIQRFRRSGHHTPSSTSAFIRTPWTSSSDTLHEFPSFHGPVQGKNFRLSDLLLCCYPLKASDGTGIDSIAADLKDNKMTIIGDMDTVAIAKKLKKLGKIDIVSVGPAKEEKKPAAAEKKGDEKKDDKKDEKKPAEKKDDKKEDKK